MARDVRERDSEPDFQERVQQAIRHEGGGLPPELLPFEELQRQFPELWEELFAPRPEPDDTPAGWPWPTEFFRLPPESWEDLLFTAFASPEAMLWRAALEAL